MAKIKELVNIEKTLLVIKHGHMFELTMNELLDLNRNIEKVGKITGTFFDTCKLYCDLVSSLPEGEDLLNKYSSRLSNEEIDFDTGECEEFINNILEKHTDWTADDL